MKITLIKPTIGHNEPGTYREKAVMEPLALSVIASITPADVKVVLYDDRTEEVPFDEKTDLVAISVETYTAKRAYEISREYRRRGVPVLLGGHHPTLMPEEAINFADCVFTGDIEGLWEEVVSDLRNGSLKKFYHSSVDIPQKTHMLRKDIYGGKKYLRLGLIQYSRGCQVGCSFCSVASFYKCTYFHRPVADVIDEIKFRRRKVWIFVDDNIVFNHSAAKELFTALIPLKIKWVSQADISVTRDPELMNLLMKSGCLGLLIGFESIDPVSIKSMNKSINLSESDNYKESVKILKNHGLLVWATFTFGHDHDTLETIENTYNFAMENKFLMADFNVLTPFPNTPLYIKLKEEDRLLYDGKWWLHNDYKFGKATFLPKNMTPQQLENACFTAYRNYLKFNSFIIRMLDRKTHLRSLRNLFLYGLCNYLSLHETVKKKDVILGMGKW